MEGHTEFRGGPSVWFGLIVYERGLVLLAARLGSPSDGGGTRVGGKDL